MPATYIFTTSAWSKEAIPLGSFVPDIRYPNEDIIKSTVAKKDFIVTVDQDFSAVVDEESQSKLEGTIAAVWAVVCSIFWNVEKLCSFQISAEEARLYTLSQPAAVFEKLCELDHVREFFRNCHRDRGIKPAFVTGYRTLTNAKVVQKDGNVSIAYGNGEAGSGGNGNALDAAQSRIEIGRQVKGGSSLECQMKGERIFAINYRKILIKVTNSAPVPSLERQTPTSWLIFSKTRGRPAGEAELMQVSLDDMDTVEGSDLVFEDVDGSFITLPEDVEGDEEDE
jgi:hypothetical protein